MSCTENLDSRLDWIRRYEMLQVFAWDADNPDDYGSRGYCYIEPGYTFKDGRYVAQKKLGWGVYSTVWLAFDTLHSQYVALKVQICDFHYTAQAKSEIDILQQVASKDPENQRCVVKLLDHFIHRARNHAHVCMVFEYLGEDIFKFTRRYSPKGLPLCLVKHICLHILDALDYFHTEFSLIHGSIQPDNICLVSTIGPSHDPPKSGAFPPLPSRQKSNYEEETSRITEACTMSLDQLVLGNNDVNDVESRQKELLERMDHRCKLIDFGHVWVPGKVNSNSIQTMPYRSPEVILGDGPSFSTSADLWSFACVCFELATGQYLFPACIGDDYCRDEDHLSRMRQHLDRIPPAMIARAKASWPRYQEWFDNKGRLRRVPTRQRRTIKERLMDDYNFNEKDATELGDFLNWILKYEPTERPSAAKVSRHKWFDDVKGEHRLISTSNERRPRDKTKLKNANVVEDEEPSTSTSTSTSKIKGKGGYKCKREKAKSKNVNDVEDDEHSTSESKENGDCRRKREQTKPRNENVCSSGGHKKGVTETSNAKAKRRRDRHPLRHT